MIMLKLCGLYVLLALVEYHEAASYDTTLLFRILALQVIGGTTDKPELLQAAKNQNKIQAPLSSTVAFPCFVNGYTLQDARSASRPTSVHKLRPGDIDVVGAIGDSLTAGTGAAATKLSHILIENKGVSWSIGGQGTWREYFTLPNMLNEFNPNLIGFSTKDGLSIYPSSQFNVGEPGAVSEDLKTMTIELVKRIKNDPRVNNNVHWKLITVMIGANDFCSTYCSAPGTESEKLDKHRSELSFTLSYLKENLPRTLVNLVPPPDTTLFATMKKLPLICQLTQRVECKCVICNTTSLDNNRMFYKKWQQIDLDVATLPEFNTDDFAVVAQPSVMDIDLPMDSMGNTDYTMFAPDCFHLSQKAHATFANALWNNMMEPVGSKSMKWEDLYDVVKCPTVAQPYIYTNGNSV